VATSPVGTPSAHSCLVVAHDPPHDGVVQGLKVSRGDVLQHQLLQAQLGYQTFQLRIFLFQLFFGASRARTACTTNS
jgi:hypothetical protein